MKSKAPTKGKARAKSKGAAARPARAPRPKRAEKSARPRTAPAEPRGIVAALSARRARRAATKPARVNRSRPSTPKPKQSSPPRTRSLVSALLLPIALLARLLPSGRVARIALVLVLIAGVGSVYHFWLRDSSLLAIDDIEVKGLSGPDGPAIAAALTKSAGGMTTLNADPEVLAEAVADFPVVRGVDIDTGLPNSATISVTATPPAMLARVAGEEDSDIPVAADGTLLPGASTEGLDLPVMELAEAPSGDELADAALEQALVIGRAPAPLRPLIETVGYSTGDGVTIGLDGGVKLEFGASDRAASKWASASAVMADPDLTQLASIDLRVPDRPAVG